MKKHLIYIGTLILLFASVDAFSQNVVNYNASAMVIQGEASGGGVISDDIALGFGFGYDFPFANPRFEYSVKFDYLYINLDYILDIDPTNIAVLRATNHQINATTGVNIYLGNQRNLANLYQPFRSYISILAGLTYQVNNLEPSANFNFTQVDGAFIVPVFELGGGVKVRVNPSWSINIGIGFRSTFSDEIDGLVGNSNSPDIMGLIRLGISKKM